MLISDPFVASYVYVRNRPGVFVDPSGLSGDTPLDGGFEFPRPPCNVPQAVTGFGIEMAGAYSIYEVLQGAALQGAPPAVKAVLIFLGALDMFAGWNIGMSDCDSDS